MVVYVCALGVNARAEAARGPGRVVRSPTADPSHNPAGQVVTGDQRLDRPLRQLHYVQQGPGVVVELPTLVERRSSCQGTPRFLGRLPSRVS